MSDLVKRLQELSVYKHSDFTIGDEAADRIEQLERENAELRAQLLRDDADDADLANALGLDWANE